MIDVLAYIAAIVAIVVIVAGVIRLIMLDWAAMAWSVGLLLVIWAGVWGATTLGWLPTS